MGDSPRISLKGSLILDKIILNSLLLFGKFEYVNGFFVFPEDSIWNFIGIKKNLDYNIYPAILYMNLSEQSKYVDYITCTYIKSYIWYKSIIQLNINKAKNIKLPIKKKDYSNIICLIGNFAYILLYYIDKLNRYDRQLFYIEYQILIYKMVQSESSSEFV